jgi:tetratricopeptide (TPR) repeat protein
MNMIDSTGHQVSGATPESLAAYEQAARELLCMVDDPVASISRAIEASPEMPMAHVLQAWLYLLGTEPEGLAAARAACEAAAALPANDREQRHLAAAQALTQGRWREAAQRLEDLSLRYPLDTLALQAGHQVDFFRGDSRMLRDRIARVLPAWDAGVPGWHAVLGMHAFGLEETGDYAQAEMQGKRSVELEPRDSWGWHAVAHVHEMRNAPREGIAWLQPASDTWAKVLKLYDQAIDANGSSLALELIDASAMLWRLQLRGVDVGDRWQSVADRWLPFAQAGNYAFNDFHAMLAFVGADRSAAQQAVLESQQQVMHSDTDNAGFTRDVGHPATRAVQAFGHGDFAGAAALLRGVRHQAHRFGGSHAQRDLIDLTLIEAAMRSGDSALARGLAAERSALRPRSPLAQRLARRAMALHGPAPQPA